MQALILVGGEGTRLRPLTTLEPKPVVRLVDQPFMAFMLEWIARHGVDRAVMSCGYKPQGIKSVLGDGTEWGVELTYVEEPTPMGTGGAMKYCEELLDDEFLMFNGDVLTDIDISAQLEQHRETGARGTLGLYPVADPSAYGLVRLNEDRSIKQFLEKPSPEEIDTNTISAGIYVLRKDVLELLEAGKPASIERDVFPRLVGDGLYGFVASPRDYWMDIGTPDRYLEATFDIIEGTVATHVDERTGPDNLLVEDGVAVADGAKIVPSALLEPGVSVAPGAVVGARALLGEGVSVGENTSIIGSVVLRGSAIGANCVLHDCVVAEDVIIGNNCQISDEAMIGRGARIGAGNVLGSGARIFPGVTLPDGAIKV